MFFHKVFWEDWKKRPYKISTFPKFNQEKV